MPDYQQGKIYKIVCNVSGGVYYGSTTNIRLCDRIADHKHAYKRYLNGLLKTNFTSFKILENNNYYYTLVELFPCNSSDELHARERFYIENNECVNKFIPMRTNKEYREDHKEHLKKKDKQKYDTKRTEILEKKKQKRYEQEGVNCECGGHYKPYFKARHLKSICHINFETSKK